MSDTNRAFLLLAGLCGALGVGLAAAGSHSGNPDLAIAANFLQLHAPVLIGLSFLKANRLAQVAGWVLVAGLTLFAGDLAVRGVYGIAPLRFAAPLGGGGLMLGWLLIAASAFWPQTPRL